MARPTHNDPQRQLSLEMERLQDRVDFAQPQDAPVGRSLPAPEALDIRHAALRSECRATIKEPRTRLLRAPCKRTPLHRARPLQAAELRLVPLGYERW
jgi:hypothetical protein